MKTTALAMAITDSELSDEEASILESGGFSVSRATTPQLTDLSEGKVVCRRERRRRVLFLNILSYIPAVFCTGCYICRLRPRRDMSDFAACRNLKHCLLREALKLMVHLMDRKISIRPRTLSNHTLF